MQLRLQKAYNHIVSCSWNQQSVLGRILQSSVTSFWILYFFRARGKKELEWGPYFTSVTRARDNNTSGFFKQACSVVYLHIQDGCFFVKLCDGSKGRLIQVCSQFYFWVSSLKSSSDNFLSFLFISEILRRLVRAGQRLVDKEERCPCQCLHRLRVASVQTSGHLLKRATRNNFKAEALQRPWLKLVRITATNITCKTQTYKSSFRRSQSSAKFEFCIWPNNCKETGFRKRTVRKVSESHLALLFYYYFTLTNDIQECVLACKHYSFLVSIVWYCFTVLRLISYFQQRGFALPTIQALLLWWVSFICFGLSVSHLWHNTHWSFWFFPPTFEKVWAVQQPRV